MSRKPAAPPLRILHLLAGNSACGATRAAQTIHHLSGNHLSGSITHAVVAGGREGQGLAGMAKGAEVIEPAGFPRFDARVGIRGLQMLARAMQGFDLILTYGDDALRAALAHALFGPGLGLGRLIHFPDATDVAAEPGLRNRWQRMIALSRASAIVVADASAADHVLRKWRQPAAKVHIVPPGIDTAAAAIKPKPDALSRVIKRRGELWLGAAVGSDAEAMALIEAFAPLRDEWQLVLPGIFPGREEIIAEAVRLGIGHRVHLPGVATDPLKIVGLFDLFAATAATQSARLIEAMAAGLTVVATDAGEAAALVSSENAPFLVPSHNRTALCGALIELAGNAGLRRRIGEANRREAKEQFDTRACARRMAGIFAAALGRSSLT